MKTKLIHFTFLLTLVYGSSCNSETAEEKTKPTDTSAATVAPVKKIPDEKNMDLYISGYQNWTRNNEIYETLSVAKIWYDGEFIIINDSVQPKFSLEIGKKITGEKSNLAKDLGGASSRTVYELQPNEQGYNELIIFTNEFEMKVLGFAYTINFTVSGKTMTKSYYANKKK